MSLPASESPISSFTKIWHTDTYPSINPSRPELSFKGKSVFITGAGTGIGARTVESFAEAGAAHIGVLARRENKLIETRDKVLKKYPQIKIHVYPGSVADTSVVERVFSDFAHISGGKIDVYINNAAYSGEFTQIGDIDTEDWWKALEINVKGALITTQAFLRHASKDATLINVASYASFMPFNMGISAYAASKAATVSMFRQMRFERPNFKVISIQPGIVASELNEKSKVGALDTGE